MKDFLKKMLAAKESKKEELKNAIQKSEDINEVRSMNTELNDVNNEIMEYRSQLAALEDKEKFNPAEARNVEKRSEDVEKDQDMEYRSAFMKYVQTGEKSSVLETRADAVGVGVAADLGIKIPLTITPLIKEEIEKITNSLYGRVKHLNVKGGIKYAIGDFSGAVFHRITETSVSERQKVGKVKEGIVFSYKIGEIRLARTLLQEILTVPEFEQEYAKVIADAYVRAMDLEILNGKGEDDQLEGIITEANKETGSRILTTNIIDVPEEKIDDWTFWRKEVFANIPLSLEGTYSEFVMAKQTYEGNLRTMKDTTGQPITVTGYNPNEINAYTFNSIGVNRVETELFPAFDKTTAGGYFAMLWNPSVAYAINSNLEFGTTEYFDQETNQTVRKAIVINDGKIVDPRAIILFRKKAPTEPEPELEG